MNSNQDIFEKQLALWNSPLVQDFYHQVKLSAGFDLPPSSKALFTEYHQHFFEGSKPDFSKDWGDTSPNWKWQKKHYDSILGSVQSALASVHYHRDNMLRIEREILSFTRMDELVTIFKNDASGSCIGGGNTQKLDFEYHAFVFSYRRTLDYLTRGVSALLKQDFHSFRTLNKGFAAHQKHTWVNEIVAIHAKYTPKLEKFLGKEDGKGTRDLIAHYLHVPAGCLNVNSSGVFFAGGGEGLSHNQTLRAAIDLYVRILEGIISETLSAIMKGHEKK